jgi:flagellar protein FliJ
LAAFKFSLATLLKIKEQFEQNTKNELGLVIQALERARHRLREIEGEIQNQVDEFGSAVSGKIDQERIEGIRRWITVLENKKIDQEGQVKKASENVDIVRAKLIALVKERKVLEKLKEKEFQLYLEEESKLEQKVIDDLVTYKERKRRE